MHGKRVYTNVKLVFFNGVSRVPVPVTKEN